MDKQLLHAEVQSETPAHYGVYAVLESNFHKDILSISNYSIMFAEKKSTSKLLLDVYIHAKVLNLWL